MILHKKYLERSPAQMAPLLLALFRMIGGKWRLDADKIISPNHTTVTGRQKGQLALRRRRGRRFQEGEGEFAFY